jgi:hypothetical protein
LVRYICRKKPMRMRARPMTEVKYRGSPRKRQEMIIAMAGVP